MHLYSIYVKFVYQSHQAKATEAKQVIWVQLGTHIPGGATSVIKSSSFTMSTCRQFHSLTSPHCSATHRVGHFRNVQRRLFFGLLPRQRLNSTTWKRAGPVTSLTHRTVLLRNPALPHVLLHCVQSLTDHLETQSNDVRNQSNRQFSSEIFKVA